MGDPYHDLADIAGDRNAFEAFYRSHLEAVKRFVARRVDDPHLVADLTADVFVAAIESARSYSAAKGPPIAWLYGVARNVIASERRKSARRLTVDRMVCGRELADGADIAAMEERIDAEAQSRELYRAMNQLSKKDRAVLELVALDGLTVQDAAKTLGIRAGSARARLHRARKAMRQMVSHHSLAESITPSEVPS